MRVSRADISTLFLKHLRICRGTGRKLVHVSGSEGITGRLRTSESQQQKEEAGEKECKKERIRRSI
jgi:hypothetical protein